MQRPGTLAILKPEWVPRFRDFTLTRHGEIVRGCWIEKDGLAVLLFEDGSAAGVSMESFRDSSV